MAVRQRSKHELVAALQTRYGKADRAGKARLLDEFCAATGYHRKHAIRVLRQGPPPPRAGHGGEPTPEAGKTTLRGLRSRRSPLNQRADLQRCDFRQGRMSRRASAERLFRPQMAELPRF